MQTLATVSPDSYAGCDVVLASLWIKQRPGL